MGRGVFGVGAKPRNSSGAFGRSTSAGATTKRAGHRPAIGLRRQFRPPRHRKAAEAVRGEDDGGFSGAIAWSSFVTQRCSMRRMPHAEFDADGVGRASSPQGLPVRRPGAAEPGTVRMVGKVAS